MQQLQIDLRRGLGGSSGRAENAGGTFLQLRFPGNNLGQMHVKQLGQFGQGLLALDGRQGHPTRHHSGWGAWASAR